MILPHLLNISNNGISMPITIYNGITVLVGANGSGKTQMLRLIKNTFGYQFEERYVRYLSAGRLAHLETFRSDFDGYRNVPIYDSAEFGSQDITLESTKMLIQKGRPLISSMDGDKLQVLGGKGL